MASHQPLLQEGGQAAETRDQATCLFRLYAFMQTTRPYAYMKKSLDVTSLQNTMSQLWFLPGFAGPSAWSTLAWLVYVSMSGSCMLLGGVDVLDLLDAEQVRSSKDVGLIHSLQEACLYVLSPVGRALGNRLQRSGLGQEDDTEKKNLNAFGLFLIGLALTFSCGSFGIVYAISRVERLAKRGLSKNWIECDASSTNNEEPAQNEQSTTDEEETNMQRRQREQLELTVTYLCLIVVLTIVEVLVNFCWFVFFGNSWTLAVVYLFVSLIPFEATRMGAMVLFLWLVSAIRIEVRDMKMSLHAALDNLQHDDGETFKNLSKEFLNMEKRIRKVCDSLGLVILACSVTVGLVGWLTFCIAVCVRRDPLTALTFGGIGLNLFALLAFGLYVLAETGTSQIRSREVSKHHTWPEDEQTTEDLNDVDENEQMQDNYRATASVTRCVLDLAPEVTAEKASDYNRLSTQVLETDAGARLPVLGVVSTQFVAATFVKVVTLFATVYGLLANLHDETNTKSQGAGFPSNSSNVSACFTQFLQCAAGVSSNTSMFLQ